jgi:hypothetical protein
MPNLFSPRIPTTWPELSLDGHITRLYISLAAYFLTLILFWCSVLGVVIFPIGVLLFGFFGAICNYFFLTWTAYKIQSTLHEAGQEKNGGWQVWVGAFFLNPALLGWYIPVSVAISAGRVRRKMTAAAPASLLI